MISVVIPVYNAEKYLKPCIESVLDQTYKDLELVLVDDGATDSSPAICDAYAAKDGRVRVVHKENTGVAPTRNRCVAEARGEWLVFVDSDDIIDTTMLDTLMEIQSRTDADIVSCGFLSFPDGTELKKPGEDSSREWTMSAREAVLDMYSSTGIGWNSWGKLMRRETFRGVEYPNAIFGEDKGTLYKVYLNAQKIVCTDRKLYYYRIRENSLTTSRSKKRILDTLAVNEDMCDYFRSGDAQLYAYACGYAAKSSFLYYASVEKEKDMEDVRAVCAEQMRKYYTYIPECRFLPAYQRTIVWLSGRSVRKKDTGPVVRALAALLRRVR